MKNDDDARTSFNTISLCRIMINLFKQNTQLLKTCIRIGFVCRTLNMKMMID